jgi:hypothetical protein
MSEIINNQSKEHANNSPKDLALEEDMARARDHFDLRRNERIMGQRIQEIVERDLNARLLTVEKLEEEVAAGNPGVQKRFVSFNGANIPVYDLIGIPFCILSTTVDHQSQNSLGRRGTETYRKVLADPSIWAERRDEAEKSSGFGTKESNARGDTISASFRNSEQSTEGYVPGNLLYGFEYVWGDSIIDAYDCDAATDNMLGKNETNLTDPDTMKKLEESLGVNCYDEILLRRYTDNGAPRKPDYIIAEDGNITNFALTHAQFFHIPIINIEKSVYEKIIEQKSEEILNSISINNNYGDICQKIAEFSSIPKNRDAYRPLTAIGRSQDCINPKGKTPLEDKCFEVSKIELIKRIEYIEAALKEAISRLNAATNKGEAIPSASIFPDFKKFAILIKDVLNQTQSTEHGDEKSSPTGLPGECNRITISFELKDTNTIVNTAIYDGERMLEQGSALEDGAIKEDDIKKADSSYYDALEPLAKRYIQAFRENQKLWSTRPKAH